MEAKKIGRFEVRRVLATDPGGLVTLAWDPDASSHVVIRTIRSDATELSDRSAWFQHECELTSRVKHPNVLQVAGTDSDPLEGPFLISECIEGTSLHHVFPKQVPIVLALRILIQAARGLAAAEAAGVLQQNLSPEHVLLSTDGVVKVILFGSLRVSPSPGATTCSAFARSAFWLIAAHMPDEPWAEADSKIHLATLKHMTSQDLDPALMEVFLRAFSSDLSARFPSTRAFMNSLISAAPMAAATRMDILSRFSSDQEPTHDAFIAELVQGFDGLEEELPLPASKAESEPSPIEPLADRPPEAQSPAPETEGQPPAPETEGQPPAPETIDINPPATPEEPDTQQEARTSAGKPLVWGLAGLLIAGAAFGAFAWFKSPKAVTISTVPPGAEILVDGQSVGHSPVSNLKAVHAGSAIEARMDGYRSASQTLQAGQSTLDLRLEALPPTKPPDLVPIVKPTPPATSPATSPAPSPAPPPNKGLPEPSPTPPPKKAPQTKPQTTPKTKPEPVPQAKPQTGPPDKKPQAEPQPKPSSGDVFDSLRQP